MMSTGNELGNGKELYLQYLVEVWRARDTRHLYTCTSAPFDQSRNDDFFVHAGGIGGMARGLAHENGKAYFNFENAISGFERPFISHEIGQYTSFPGLYSWFNEEKYTGPLEEDAIRNARSRKGNFVSVTITVNAQSQEQLDNIYREVSAHEAVLMAL